MNRKAKHTEWRNLSPKKLTTSKELLEDFEDDANYQDGSFEIQTAPCKTLVKRHKELIDSLFQIGKKLEYMQQFEPVSPHCNRPLLPHQQKMIESYRNSLGLLHQQIFVMRQFQTADFFAVLHQNSPKMLQKKS